MLAWQAGARQERRGRASRNPRYASAECCRPQCPTGHPMLVRNAPVDWTRHNRTLGTASCWRSSTPSLDGVLPIWVLFSRSHASQPPLSMPPTPLDIFGYSACTNARTSRVVVAAFANAASRNLWKRNAFRAFRACSARRSCCCSRRLAGSVEGMWPKEPRRLLLAGREGLRRRHSGHGRSKSPRLYYNSADGDARLHGIAVRYSVTCRILWSLIRN